MGRTDVEALYNCGHVVHHFDTDGTNLPRVGQRGRCIPCGEDQPIYEGAA